MEVNPCLDVLSGIDKRGLHLSPEDQQRLETLRGKVGAETQWLFRLTASM